MRENQGHFVIESYDDLKNYEIIFHEEIKSNVFMLHLKKDLKEIQQFKIVFCKSEYMPKSIWDHNNYWRVK